MIDRALNPDFLNSFLNHSKAILNKSPNSIKEYNYDLANFLKFIMIKYGQTNETDYEKIIIKDMSVDTLKKITLDDIYDYLSYMTDTFNSKAATRARKASTIRIFFKYLTINAKILEINPAQNLESPKLDKRQPNYLTLEDSQKLLNITKNEEENRNAIRDYTIITLFLNCGMRLAELVNINIEDIEFSECKMKVIGKGNKQRTVYLNKACMKNINEYLKIKPEGLKDSQNSDKALFLSERRTRISRRTVQHIVEKELHNAGLDSKHCSVHKLRHTAATLMYQYGQVDIRALQELLGHASISTTEIYTHVENEQVRNAVERNPLANE
ncbi:MAG: tyrosine recombinase XerC [Clostridia bacterium]|nr:tyrosine recombinase XerC [Clostridia bacterium]